MVQIRAGVGGMGFPRRSSPFKQADLEEDNMKLIEPAYSAKSQRD